MKHAIHALRMLVFMTVLTGVAYPLLVTALSQALFKDQANGSIVRGDDAGSAIGSILVAQNFESPKYFWPRPSGGASYNPLPSGGTNLSQVSADLKKTVDERKARLKAAHPDMGEPPQDLLFSSGSGLDPEISPDAARYQLARVAKARNMEASQVNELVQRNLAKRQLGILGEPRVNVLALNMALDHSQGIRIAPVYVPPRQPPASPPPAEVK